MQRSKQHLRRLCSRFSTCDACQKHHLRRLSSIFSVCGTCAAPEAASATPVQQIQHLRSLSKQHLRRLCSRFAARSTIGDACKQHLRRLCSARSNICDACAADSAPATPVRSSVCDASGADLPEAAFATPVNSICDACEQQICCQKQHWRRL